MSKQLKADIALFFVTIGWGASFLLTKNSLSYLQTFNFLAIRFFIAFVLSSLVFIKKMIKINKKSLKYGVILGLILYAVYAFQTLGLNYISVSRSAFITGVNVILVPIFSAYMMKNKLAKKTIFSTVMAFLGLALLTLNSEIQGICIGDVFTLICAILFALYIIYVGKYDKEVEAVSLAVLQLGVVSLLSFITSIIIEQPTIPTETNAWINIIILSVICTSGAYIVQSVAQKYTSPTHTALIYTCEPVFAAIFGYYICDVVLGVRGTIGAILIVFGMVMSELDLKYIKEKITKITTQ